MNKRRFLRCQRLLLSTFLYKVVCDVIGIAIELGVHLVAGVVEHGKHRLVAGQDFSKESFYAAILGDLRNVLQKESPHTLLLPFLPFYTNKKKKKSGLWFFFFFCFEEKRRKATKGLWGLSSCTRKATSAA